MAKFKFKPIVNPYLPNITARIGTAVAPLSQPDVGKLVKFIADSNYDLCAVDDEIEGVLETSNEQPKTDGFEIGGINKHSAFEAILDGTGTIGALLVCGAVTAKGTKMPAQPHVKVGTPTNFKWRLVSFISGTGAAGSVVLVQRLGD